MTSVSTGWSGEQQAAHKITTATGSVYIIDNGFWKKNKSPWVSLMWAYSIDAGEARSWSDINSCEQLPIQVGANLSIGGYSEWWVSTPIVKIEELASRVQANQIPAHPTRPRFAMD